MKLNAKTVQDLIDSIPIVKLLSKNVGAAGAIGFVIQDFVLPLYGDFIVPIVLSLAGAGFVAFALWFFIFKIDTSDNFNHVSFQASIVCVLLSVVIFGFSFLSKALSGDDGRGLLGSQVGFVADLQDNANVYKEDAEALAKIAENYSDMQMQLATLNTQIANQMSQNGQLDDDLKSQISEIMSSSVPGNNDSSRVSQLEKELDIAYELLRQMSMNNQVLQSDEKDDFKDRIQQAKNDSIFSIISSLNSQIKDLENVSASMLSDLKSLDKSAELAELKELTLEIIEKEDQITKVIQESEKKANKAMRKELDEITSTIKRRGNRGDKENEKYLDEIVNSYEKVLSKVENRKSKRDERNTDKQLAETQKEIDELKVKLIEYESAQIENESNEELSSLKTLISQLESYNEVQTSNVQNLQQDTQSQIGELTSSMSQILNDITDLKAMIVNSGNNIQNTNDEVEITYKSKVEESIDENIFNKFLDYDILTKKTNFGIHKDDYLFYINNKPIKNFASQGQQKSFIISLKMSEYYIISEKLSISPLMMLDDIFDKLDNKRISDLMKFIKNKIKGQIFITDALNDRIKIFNSKDYNMNIISIKNGEINFNEKK